MARSLHLRLPAVLVASAAATALAAAPALATEGPTAPPPASFANGIAAPTFAPVPAATTPATRSSKVIKRARLAHRRVRRGHRALLRISLTSPSRLRIVISRRPSGRRVRTVDVPARGRAVALRLPARSNGHSLASGRYRVRIVAIDASGKRSQTVLRTLIVRKAR